MDRFTWGFVIGAVALCIVAVGGVFWARRTTPPPLSTPAGAVTAYIQAIYDRDADRACSLLSPDASVGPPSPAPAAAGSRRDLFCRQLASTPRYGSGAARVRVVEVSEKVDTARVDVEITTGGGATLFSSELNRTVAFSLKRVDGAWRIETAPSIYEIG